MFGHRARHAISVNLVNSVHLFSCHIMFHNALSKSPQSILLFRHGTPPHRHLSLVEPLLAARSTVLSPVSIYSIHLHLSTPTHLLSPPTIRLASPLAGHRVNPTVSPLAHIADLPRLLPAAVDRSSVLPLAPSCSWSPKICPSPPTTPSPLFSLTSGHRALPRSHVRAHLASSTSSDPFLGSPPPLSSPFVVGEAPPSQSCLCSVLR